MPTINRILREALKEKEKELQEKAKRAKQERKLALKIGTMAVKFCKKRKIEDPLAHIVNLLNKEENNG